MKAILGGLLAVAMLLGVLPTLVAPVAAVADGPTTVPILLDYTTYVTSGDPTEAPGNSIEVLVISSTYPEIGNCRAYVHASLNQIPSGATILSANLKMRVYYMEGGSGDNDVHRVNDFWTGTSGPPWGAAISWNTQPSFQSSPTDSKPTNVNIDDWISWDVTADVQAFMSGVPNYGWVVKYSVEDSEYAALDYYGCGNDYAPGVQPYLEVTYTEAAPAPVAAFTSDVQSGTAPLTVSFTDQSTNSPTSWAWDFDNDGTVDSTDQNPTHTYTSAGTYTVKLTATNAGGSDDEIKTDYITVASPVPAWDLNGDHVCNIGDVVVIGLHWGEAGTPGWIPQDLNNDGVINIGDVVVLGLHWGETW